MVAALRDWDAVKSTPKLRSPTLLQLECACVSLQLLERAGFVPTVRSILLEAVSRLQPSPSSDLPAAAAVSSLMQLLYDMLENGFVLEARVLIKILRLAMRALPPVPEATYRGYLRVLMKMFRIALGNVSTCQSITGLLLDLLAPLDKPSLLIKLGAEMRQQLEDHLIQGKGASMVFFNKKVSQAVASQIVKWLNLYHQEVLLSYQLITKNFSKQAEEAEERATARAASFTTVIESIHTLLAVLNELALCGFKEISTIESIGRAGIKLLHTVNLIAKFFISLRDELPESFKSLVDFIGSSLKSNLDKTVGSSHVGSSTAQPGSSAKRQLNIMPKLKYEEETLEASLLTLFKGHRGLVKHESILNGYAETRVRGFRVNLESVSYTHLTLPTIA